MKLSIIVPVFNEEKTVIPVLKNLCKLSLPSVRKEIIVVNDGSTDKTPVKIEQFKKSNPIIVLSNIKNQGKGVAVINGIKRATGDYILIQDADLEYNPLEIQKLIGPIKKGEATVVYGTRLKRPPNLKRDERNVRFFVHYVGNKLLSLLTSLLYGQWITDMETGYKLFPKTAFASSALHAKGFELEPEITAKLLKKKYRIMEIPISTNPRGYEEGKKLNTVRDGFIALWSLFKYRVSD